VSAPFRGHGKVILVGEHAAVYGHAALAGALACGVTLRARASDQLSLDVAGWNVHVRGGDDHPVARALEAVARTLGVDRAALEGAGDVPPAAGLGSSAALAVALARALAAHGGKVLDDAAIEDVAASAERCFHGNPSGIDVAVAARGGLGLYRRGHGLTPIGAAPLRILIGLSGEPRSTAIMVERVAQARAARTAAVDAELAALGDAAQRAAAIVCAPIVDLAELGEIFTDAHARLSSLGVSAPVLDAMVAAAAGAGASGAKLTGGGGGGAVIALAPGREDAVLAAWRAIGKDGFVTDVGVRA
jgi:mevalonate kinase